MKKLLRLLLPVCLGLFFWTCNVTDSTKPDTFTLQLNDSLKQAAHKYDSIRVDLYNVNGKDTVFSKTLFSGPYLDSAQLADLPLGVGVKNFIIKVKGFKDGKDILDVGLPFAGGKPGKVDTLINIARPDTNHSTNHPPILKFADPQTASPLSIKEGGKLNFQLSASDADVNDGAEFLSLANPPWPACGQGSFDTVTGTLTFTPSFKCVTNGDSTSYDIIFMAKDRGTPVDTGKLTVHVAILDSNSAPRWSTDATNVTGKEGRPMFLSLAGLFQGDAEGDAVSFTSACGTVNKDSMTWSFTPGFRDAGQKDCPITAMDNHVPSASSQLTLKLGIEDSVRLVDVAIISPVNGYATRDSVVKVKWQVGSVDQTSQTSEKLLAEGVNTIHRSFTDALGNHGEDSVKVTLDTKAPEQPQVHVVSQTNNPRPKFSWQSGGNGVGFFRFKLDDANLSADTLGRTDTALIPTSDLSNGAHVLYVQERDAVGNWSQSGSGTVTVNTAAPTVKIIEPANGFATRDSEVTVKWQVGGVDQAPSSEKLTNEGINVIHRSYTDALGNHGEDSVKVTLDTKPPVAPQVHVVSPTNNPRPKFSWASTQGGGGNGTFRFKLDDLSLAGDTLGKPDTSFIPSADLSNGVHILYVEERDAVGNWSDAASAAVSINTLAPTVKITSPVNGFATNQTNLDVQWSLNGVAQTKIVKTLVEGSNGIRVTFKDSAGNVGSDSITVILDTQAPLKPQVHVLALTKNPKPIWTWKTGGGGNGKYRVKLDGGSDLTSGSTPIVDTVFAAAANLASGRHVLYVQEQDDVGNWSPSDSGIIVVDLDAPVVLISSPVDGFLTNASSVPVTWSVDGSPQNSLKSESLVGKQGSILIIRSSTDAAGNTGSDTVTITRDTIAPASPVFTAQTSPSIVNAAYTLPVQWVWTRTGAASDSFLVSVNGAGAIKQAGTSYTLPSPSNQTYLMDVREVDAAGNASASVLDTILVDKVAPPAPTVSGTTPTATPTWTWSNNGDGNGKFRYRLSTASTYSSETSNTTYAPTDLTTGSYTLLVQERDAAGNWSSDGSFTIVVDKTGPSLSIVSPSDFGSVCNFNTTISGTVVDGQGSSISKVEYRLNTAGYVAVSATGGNWTFTPSYNVGANTVWVRGTDGFGNKDSIQVNIYKYPNVKFVREGATGTGSSWADAYGDLHKALDTNNHFPDGTQLWVTKGMYGDTTSRFGDTAKYISIDRSNISVYGGFFTDHPSISSDISQRDTSFGATNIGSYFFINLVHGVILDGFSLLQPSNIGTSGATDIQIRNVKIRGIVSRYRDGIINSDGIVTFEKCEFINLHTRYVFQVFGGTTTLNNCTFKSDTTGIAPVWILGQGSVISRSDFFGYNTGGGSVVNFYFQDTTSGLDIDNCKVEGGKNSVSLSAPENQYINFYYGTSNSWP